MRFEETLLTHCAPTIAGIKPASLIRWCPEDPEAFSAQLPMWKRLFLRRGVTLTVLKDCPESGAKLLYLYRREQLEAVLEKPEIRQYLAGSGYTRLDDSGALLRQLSGRLCTEGDFPHEIGVFLGYPLEDVIGFQRNQGRNFRCCGYWKVYGDPEKAARLFSSYRRCTAELRQRYLSGVPLEQLIVRC